MPFQIINITPQGTVEQWTAVDLKGAGKKKALQDAINNSKNKLCDLSSKDAGPDPTIAKLNEKFKSPSELCSAHTCPNNATKKCAFLCMEYQKNETNTSLPGKWVALDNITKFDKGANDQSYFCVCPLPEDGKIDYKINDAIMYKREEIASEAVPKG